MNDKRKPLNIILGSTAWAIAALSHLVSFLISSDIPDFLLNYLEYWKFVVIPWAAILLALILYNRNRLKTLEWIYWSAPVALSWIFIPYVIFTALLINHK